MKAILFTYLLTAAGAVSSLFDPFYGLMVYVLFAVIRPDWMWRWTLPEGNYSRTVAIAMLAGWVIHGFGRWHFGRAAAILGAMFLYWGWSVLSNTASVDPDRGWEYIEFFGKVSLPVLVGLTTIRTVRQLKMLAWLMVLAQGYVAFELNVAYFEFVRGQRSENLIVEEGFGGMDNNCVAIGMVTTFGLAFFLGMGAKKWWMKGVAFFCALLMAHCIMISFSRGGLLALCITGVLIFFLIPKGPFHYLTFLLAVALGIRMAGPQVIERFSTAFATSSETREASAQGRLELWSNCIDLTIKNPLLGIGPDQFGFYAPEYGWPKGKEAHSLWLQNAAEVGLPGVGFLAGFFVLCIVRLWPLTRDRTYVFDPWSHDAARMVISSLVGFLVAAQFVTIRYLEIPFYITLIGAGVLMLESRRAAGLSPAA